MTPRIFRRPRGRAVESPDRRSITDSLTPDERDRIAEARPHTLLSDERIVACIDAVRYAVRREIPGALVECGVWRGGAVLAMIRTLQELGASDRDIFLFDTFEGMTEPTDVDVSLFEGAALPVWQQAKSQGRRAWDFFFKEDVFSLEQVKELISSTGYPSDRIRFVPGMVEDTIPASAPDQIAVLRLDTDWYESTKHELVHLYPRLASGGVLLIDDYGHWDGCRRAVDEYFGGSVPPLLLSRTDYTGRMAIKA